MQHKQGVLHKIEAWHGIKTLKVNITCFHGSSVCPNKDHNLIFINPSVTASVSVQFGWRQQAEKKDIYLGQTNDDWSKDFFLFYS